MTSDERAAIHRKIRLVADAVREIERKVDMKILKCTCSVSSGEKTLDNDKVCFTGYNCIEYNIPVPIFMALPPKRAIIEITRALSIEYNDYGDYHN